jgi:hypothetical protein
MNRILESSWRGFARYASAEDGASASEFALMLLILGGCVATALHVLGTREGRLVISLNDLLASHPTSG